MARTRNRELLAQWEEKKNTPIVTAEPPKEEPILPEPVSPTEQDNKLMEALASHVVNLSQMVETMTIKKQVNIIATIQRDEGGKMSSILITERK